MAYWSVGSGRIELDIPRKVAAACSHAGQCDSDVMAASRLPRIARQLAKLDVGLVASELREYGAWDETELSDHQQNLQRLLWIACGDISDGNN